VINTKNISVQNDKDDSNGITPLKYRIGI
jgi:hypothetical protein